MWDNLEGGKRWNQWVWMGGSLLKWGGYGNREVLLKPGTEQAIGQRI